MNIIDIGSNSVRLMTGGEKFVATTRLAEGMRNGELSPSSMERTKDAVKEFCQRGECVAFATEAVRRATNKRQFLDLIYNETGLVVHILSGEEEAEIGFIGATCGYDGEATVIDLGGASCEIVNGINGKISYMHSFPFGCVVLSDMFGKDTLKAESYVSEFAIPRLSGKCFAIGGTATSLAAMKLRLAVYDRRLVDGTTLDVATVKELAAEAESGVHFPTLSPERKKTIVQGATALCVVMEKLGGTATVSESDNLEGYRAKYLM